MVKWVAAEYHRFIDWIGDGTGLPDTVLHIHAGLAVFVAARLLTGRSFGTYIPFLAVVLAEGGNEVLDRLNYGSWRWADTISDIIHTLAWPLIITLGVRIRPLLSHRVEAAVPVDEAADPFGQHDARVVAGERLER
ncbi:hypothetical protein ACFSC3_03750 [Sphingomonas floccifaciens]|uniref:VanZ-like domain-containing protein n=1 Tax=Sphingomonas floccifaciens TaxID=1844115 RepID=A0ABW4NA27_9SPHN